MDEKRDYDTVVNEARRIDEHNKCDNETVVLGLRNM